MKHVKILVCIALISGQSSYAMDMTSFAKNSPKKNSATDKSDTLDKNEEQLSLSGQDLLDYVNEQLDALEQEVALVSDPVEAKQLVAERLVKIAYITNTDLSGLANIVDQAIDIVAQDIASQDADQDESQVVIQGENESSGKFSQELVIIAQGLKSAITIPLFTAVGVGLGAAAGAATAIVLPVGLALDLTMSIEAPWGKINKNDSFATKAVKLLPNILSRALVGVVTVSVAATIGSLGIIAGAVVGGAYGGMYANLDKENRNQMFEEIKDEILKTKRQKKLLVFSASSDYEKLSWLQKAKFSNMNPYQEIQFLKVNPEDRGEFLNNPDGFIGENAGSNNEATKRRGLASKVVPVVEFQVKLPTKLVTSTSSRPSSSRRIGK